MTADNASEPRWMVVEKTAIAMDASKPQGFSVDVRTPVAANALADLHNATCDKLDEARAEVTKLKATVAAMRSSKMDDEIRRSYEEPAAAPISDRDRIEWMVQLACAAMSAGNTYMSPEGRANDAKVRLEAIIAAAKERA